MLPQWIIEKKRDGNPLTPEEIRFFIHGYTCGNIPDYQMSALAMAIFFRGMSFDETVALTDTMLRSGDQVNTSGLHMPKADKHSTGGIGDKVSLILAPLVACCGIAVPMISGRGLGLTGGTLDKLESIPGYRTRLSRDEFLSVIQQCGCSIIGQTEQLVPADRKLYSLRDVTGTVPSIPLISASIMSKKLAEGTDALVLDVKWGNGAFMKTQEQARELADTMVEIGRRMNCGMSALITDMNQPLGRSAGNATEIVETVEALQGRGPADVMDETLELGAHMLILTGVAATRDDAIGTLRKHIDSGSGFERFKEMVRLHGGDVSVLDTPEQLLTATCHANLTAEVNGYIGDVNAELIGKACVLLGAGRTRTDDIVDPAVGITHLVKIGEAVHKRDPLLKVHANDRCKLDEAIALMRDAIVIVPHPVKSPSLIVDVIGPYKRGAK